MLRARLYEIELKKREEQAAADQAAKTDIGWGHQIRSYVLQPYQMVKDLRTGVQTSDTAACSTATSTNSWQRRWRNARSAPRPVRSRMWTNMTQVAFIGIGRMGHGMAGRYLDGGFTVALWNRSKPKAEDLIARGARWASSPADAADGADAIVTMVADDEASRAVWLGADGAASRAKAGTIAIECSTVSYDHALDLAPRASRARSRLYRLSGDRAA